MTTEHNEQQARSLLALGLDEFGYHTEAANVRKGIDLDDYKADLWAIRAALDTQPGAAQEAVAWQVGDEFYPSESLAIEAIQQWGPSGAIAIPLYAAAPVTAAPADTWFADQLTAMGEVIPLASTPAALGIDRCSLLDIVAWWNAYTGPVDEALGEVIRRIRALIDASPKGDEAQQAAAQAIAIVHMGGYRWNGQHWRKDSPKGALNEQFGSAEGLGGPKGGSAARLRTMVVTLAPLWRLSDSWLEASDSPSDKHRAMWGCAKELRDKLVQMQTQAGDAEVQP